MNINLTPINFGNKKKIAQTTLALTAATVAAGLTEQKKEQNLVNELDTLAAQNQAQVKMANNTSDIKNTIFKVLQEAVNNKEFLTIAQIAERANSTPNKIKKALYTDSELYSEYTKIKIPFSSGERYRKFGKSSHLLKREDDIKKYLIQVANEQRTTSIAEIAENTGYTTSEVIASIYHTVDRDKDLKALYDNVKSKRNIPVILGKNINNATKLVEGTVPMSLAEESVEQAVSDYKKYFAKQLTQMNFDENDIKEFSNIFVEFPAFADTLLFATDDKGNSRLKYSRKAEILKAIYESYKLNPDMMENMLFEKNVDGLYKYEISTVCEAVKINKISPKLVSTYIEQPQIVTKLLNEKIDGKPRFGIDEINKIADFYKISPRFVNYITFVGGYNGIPRFTQSQILKILEFYKINPELTDKIVKTRSSDKTEAAYPYKYTPACIDKIIDVYMNGDEEQIKILNGLQRGDKQYLPINYVSKYPSEAIIQEMNKYEARKELMDMIDSDELTTDEIKQKFKEKFGTNGRYIVGRLANMGFNLSEIRRILVFTETKITQKDIEKSNIVYTAHSYINIHDDLGQFIDDTRHRKKKI